MRNTRLDEILSGKEANYLLPFYWQHGDHTERIPEQIQRIYDSGARALCVESRPHNDFCGEGWWRDMDIILAESKKRGMKVWILDDDHFPTGHANGAVEKHPELAQWLVKEHHVDIPGPMEDLSIIVPSFSDEDELIGAYALLNNNDADESCSGKPVDLTGNVENGMLYWSAPEGIWRVYLYIKTRSGGRKNYIDMINQDSVRLLIEAVYEPHWAHYADEFGKTIAGFFSDEPSFGNVNGGTGGADMYNAWIGSPRMALPWNARVKDMMQEELGYDPMPHLHALWYEDEYRAEVRFAYMDAITKLYDECFAGQLGDWCRAHGVEYIGHIIEDMHAHSRLSCSAGHFFRALRGQDMSGIDVVLHQIVPGLPDTIHPACISGKRYDSHFFDYTLAKLGASLAHLDPRMKGRAMCEIFGAYGWAEDSVMQKRLMDHMLVRGINHYVPHAFSPKYPDPDCPPHFGAEGFDPSFEAFSALMKYTNQVSHMLCGAVHVASVALLYDAELEWTNRCGTIMLNQAPAKVLYDHQLDYDFVPMDMLENAAVKNGMLCINGESFGCLVIPAAQCLPEKLTGILKSLADAGLKLLFVDRKPDNAYFDGETVALNDLPGRVEELGLRDVAVEGKFPHLRVYHVCRDESDVFFFVNEDASVVADTTVRLPVSGTYARLDLLNDACTRGVSEDGKVALNLLPGQSQMIVFAENEFPEEYTLVRDETLMPHYTLDLAACEDMNHFQRWMEGDVFLNVTAPKAKPDFSGKMRYCFEFNASTGKRLFMNLGRVGQNACLKVNGVDCGIRICPPYRFEITNAVRDGINTAEVIVANTLVQRVRDEFSTYLPIAPSGLLGPVSLESVK